MPDLEDIISRMIRNRPDLSREVLLRAISEKKREIGSRFLSDEGAAYIVASELNLDLDEGKGPSPSLSIRDLVSGLNDVTISGTIAEIRQLQTFQKSNGSTGKVRRITISDQTDSVGVVLWDEKADLIAHRGIAINDLVRVLHGYVKESLEGGPEIHVGNKGDIVSIRQQTIRSEDFQGFTPISRLSRSDRKVDVHGRISRIMTVRRFKKSNGSDGTVLRVKVTDASGAVTVVAWDEKAVEMANATKGCYIQVRNGHVRDGIRGNLEIHVDSSGKVELGSDAPSDLATAATPRNKIASIRPGDVDLLVVARLTAKGSIVNFRRPRGEAGRVANLIIQDETGSARLTLWDEKVDVLDQLSIGDLLLVEGAYAKENMGRTDLNLARSGEITCNPQDIKVEIPQIDVEPVKIGELKPEMRDVSIAGRVMDTPTIKDVTTGRGPTEVTSVRIKDVSGDVNVSIWGRLAKEAVNLKVGDSIIVRHLYTRPALHGSLELSSTSFTTIDKKSQTK